MIGAASSPWEPTPLAGTFRKEVTEDKVFRKLISHDKTGYGTKRVPFQKKRNAF